jgi:cell division protein FtsQ
MEQLDAWPEIRSKVKAYVRISGRRWDLHLNNGIIIKLPEVNVAKALHLLSRLDAEQQVMSRDIAAIDLRLSDRTTIQLTQAATERREAAVTAREKALKKAGNI